MVRNSCLPLPVRIPARLDTWCETRRRKAVIQAKPVPLRATLELRVPCPLGRAVVVMTPHVGPPAGRQLAEVLGTDECLAGFIAPVRAGIEVANEEKGFM